MKIKEISAHVLSNSTIDSFKGYDPFDGLNSTFFKLMPLLKKGLFGLAWIQFHKRSFINFRPLMAIPKGRNPKGIALFILGMLEDYRRTKDDLYLNEAQELADWLLTQQSDKTVWKHACWGYHFDWNARAFFVPKGKPNVITTVYVAQALYALGKQTHNQQYIDVAFDAANFIVNTLYTEADNRQFFAYIPDEKAFVHNASLWAAAWVAFVGKKTANEKFKQLALAVARQSIAEQTTAGAWVYGAREHHQFIDGFHTGYNLEALNIIGNALETKEFDASINLGLAYYKRELITEDGIAKYYHHNLYPLDMHSVTQAIITLIKVGGTEEDFTLASKVANKAIDTLYMPQKKRFVYQRNRYFTNRINYMRWTQAWVYYSFAMYNRIADYKGL